MNETRIRRILIGMAAILVVAWLVWYWRRPGLTLAVIRPRVETIREFVTDQAVTHLPRSTLISMPIDGWLQPITLREGDAVTAGQTVAKIDTRDLAARITQVRQRIAVLESKIRRAEDHRLENDALIQANAVVKAMDETVSAAEANATASRAVAEFARFELDRIKKIGARDAASQRELREAESAYRRAWATYRSNVFQHAAIKALAAVSHIGPKSIRDYIDLKTYDREQFRSQLAAEKAQLEIERRNLARTDITSPIDGVVLTRHQSQLRFLSTGAPLLTLGRLDDMEVIADILTERAPRIRPGNPAEILGEAITGGPIAGSVLRVYPEGFKKVSSLGVEQQRVYVAVKMARRPPRLGVAFRVEVRIYYDRADNALTIPRTVLFRGPRGQWQVMTVRNGRTSLRTVTLGLQNEDRAQVLSGLDKDDLLVAEPARDISPGTRVRTVLASERE